MEKRVKKCIRVCKRFLHELHKERGYVLGCEYGKYVGIFSGLRRQGCSSSLNNMIEYFWEVVMSISFIFSNVIRTWLCWDNIPRAVAAYDLIAPTLIESHMTTKSP